MTVTIERQAYQVEQGTLSALTAGALDGEQIILLHGMPASAELFRGVIPILAEAGYRVIAPDMAGYGHTRMADSTDYSLSASADLFAKWIEAEGLNPVWLIGHDLGGGVAQMMAVRYPHLIAHLSIGNTLVADSFPVFAVNMAIMIAKTGLFPTLASLGLIPNPYMSWEVRKGFGDTSKLTPEMMKRVFWDGKASDPQGRRKFAQHLKHLRNDESVAIAGQLKDIPMPTQLLWAEQDRHQPIDTIGKRLHDLLPDGTPFDRMPNAGHFVPAEAPQLYAETLLNWRRGV